MTITSPAFEADQPIPARYTCDEENESPPLTFVDVPDDAKSLALVMHDPDAPMGDFVHWVAWNIFPDVADVQAGVPPDGAEEGVNGAGEKGYTGPCPPSGLHHYHFNLFALDTRLDLPEDTDRDALLSAIEGHEVAAATLIGTYSRG